MRLIPVINLRIEPRALPATLLGRVLRYHGG